MKKTDGFVTIEDVSEWTVTYRKNKTEVERCYMKRHKGDNSTERRSIPTNLEKTRCE